MCLLYGSFFLVSLNSVRYDSIVILLWFVSYSSIALFFLYSIFFFERVCVYVSACFRLASLFYENYEKSSGVLVTMQCVLWNKWRTDESTRQRDNTEGMRQRTETNQQQASILWVFLMFCFFSTFFSCPRGLSAVLQATSLGDVWLMTSMDHTQPQQSSITYQLGNMCETTNLNRNHLRNLIWIVNFSYFGNWIGPGPILLFERSAEAAALCSTSPWFCAAARRKAPKYGRKAKKTAKNHKMLKNGTVQK